MSPGDRILIHMHDTPAGLRIDLNDLTSRQSGSMTASVANGFGHILYTPNSTTCQQEPYAFHPEYSTGQPRGNTWSAHTYNVAMSDEIGHFENCLQLDAEFNCAVPGTQDPGGLDEDDDNNFCVPGTDSTLVMINGCFSGDEDWDGQSYRNDWPGTSPERVPRPAAASVAGAVHQPARQREDELLDGRLRDRPPAHRGRRRTGQPTVLRSHDRGELRQPAQRRAVLSVLHDRGAPGNLRLATGRQLHPGHHQPLRRELHDRVRSAVADRVSGGRLHHRPLLQQLQQRRQTQPLPRGVGQI